MSRWFCNGWAWPNRSAEAARPKSPSPCKGEGAGGACLAAYPALGCQTAAKPSRSTATMAGGVRTSTGPKGKGVPIP